MIDLAGVPAPDDAPAHGACVRVERPEDGLARIVLDPPHRPKIAVFDVPLLRDLDEALTELASDPGLKGLVVTGRNPLSFAAGADVEAIAKLDDPDVAARFVAEVQALFQRLHRLGRDGGGRVRTVAAVGGPVPGGACEIALACDRIVMADDDKSRIGLPEVMLGILPAWGGTTRLPRRIGVPAALNAILSGRLFRARAAYKLGMVDRLTKPEYLVRIADDIALGRASCPHRGRKGFVQWAVDKNPLAGAFAASQARQEVMRKTKGHYPAPLTVLPLVVRAARIKLEDGLEAEREAVRPLAESPVSANLLRVFLASEAAKKLAEGPDGKKAAPFRRAAVIGAGVMGGAIASVLAEKGTPTRLRDLSREALDEAVVSHANEITKKRKRRRLTRARANGALDRLEVTTEAAGFARCDVVIEAVAERLEVKQAVFGELAELLADDAVLASNTSSLSITAIAKGLPNPERVVGMHFFNPVRKMPLVEVVRGKKTSDEVVARVARLAVDLGKTPVVTKDVPGFLVNRVLGPYLDEAIRLVELGADPLTLDAALVDFGMPMGPMELLDEVGLDIASHAGQSLEEGYGERMKASKFLLPLVESGHLGKKSGQGIYVWERDKKGKLVNKGRNPHAPQVALPFTMTLDRAVDRVLLAMVNEAARALDEEVVDSPVALDLATIFGTGFAPFRGGVLRYADHRGLRDVCERLKDVRDAPDVTEERTERFEPAANLAALAEKNGTFHAS